MHGALTPLPLLTRSDSLLLDATGVTMLRSMSRDPRNGTELLGRGTRVSGLPDAVDDDDDSDCCPFPALSSDRPELLDTAL